MAYDNNEPCCPRMFEGSLAWPLDDDRVILPPGQHAKHLFTHVTPKAVRHASRRTVHKLPARGLIWVGGSSSNLSRNVGTAVNASQMMLGERVHDDHHRRRLANWSISRGLFLRCLGGLLNASRPERLAGESARQAAPPSSMANGRRRSKALCGRSRSLTGTVSRLVQGPRSMTS
jgi:hypothetical protein